MHPNPHSPRREARVGAAPDENIVDVEAQARADRHHPQLVPGAPLVDGGRRREALQRVTLSL